MPVIMITILLNGSVSARGIGSSMGNIKTVASDGSFDAARNPALLPLLTQNTAGAYFSYKYYSNIEIDSLQNIHMEKPTQNLSVGSSDSTADKPEMSGLSGHAACTLALDKIYLGFAAAESDKDQYFISKSTSSTTLWGTIGGSDATLNIDSKTETSEINPAFVSSLGFSIADDSFIGFQIIVTSLNKTEKTQSDTIIQIAAASANYKEEVKKEDTGISAEIGIGILKKTENTQIGLLIKSGEFTWLKKSADFEYYRNDGTVNSGLFTGGTSRSLDGVHTTGINITAGGFSRINSLIAVACEASFRLYNGYSDKDMKLNTEPVNPVFGKESSTITINNSFSFGCGIEINPLNDLAVTLGIGRINFSSDSGDNEYSDYDNGAWGYNSSDYSFITSGLQYSLLDNVNLIISGAFIKIETSGRYSERKYDDTTGDHQEFYLKQKLNGNLIDIGMGVDFTF